MNKKLLLKMSIISLLSCNNHYQLINAAQTTSMTLPQDERAIWKWSPFRMGSHLLWGQQLGQDFWETNSKELSTSLAKFKTASTNEEKTIILKNVMENSSKAYQNVIQGLESNYRRAMSYILEKFQNECPDSTILYFPDHKLVAMYKKDAPDEEKAKIMFNLLTETKKAIDDKKKQSGLELKQNDTQGKAHPTPAAHTTTTTTTTIATPEKKPNN